MSHPVLRTHRWRKLRASVISSALAHGAPCGLCGGPLSPADLIDVDHVVPLSVAPELAYDPGNLRATHARCNRSAGASMGNRSRGKRPLDETFHTSREW